MSIQSDENAQQKDFEDFTKQLELIDNTRNTNILDQLPSYNYNETLNFIRNIQSELDQQKTLNSLLESSNEDINNHITNVKKFAEENNEKIQSQLEKIKTISSELKDLVNKNNSLKDSHSELLQITNNEQYKSMAKNMQEIKRQKEDIRSFLEEMGIVSPPLNF